MNSAAPLLAPLAVVAGAARALTGHEPTADRIQALCQYLRASLPAAAVRFHGRVRRSDFAAAGVIPEGAAIYRAVVPRSDRRTATIEVADSPRPAAELQEVLDAVGALLAAVLSASASEESDDDGALARIHRLTIDSLPVGLYVVDRELRVVLWNRKRETGTQGLRRSDVLGRRVTEVLRRQSATALEAAFAQVFATGIAQEHEQEVRVGDEVRTYRTSRLPMLVDGVTVSHVVTIGEDVTETRAIQRAMHQAEKLAAVGQLAAGVMHEINNPLATIGGCAGAITARLGRNAPAPVVEYLGMIESEVARCTGIIEGLLDFSRAGGPGIAFAPTDLNAVVLRTLDLLQHHQRFRRLHVTRELVTPLPAIAGHEERLVQAAMAILLNAADAMAGAGNLVVRTVLQGEQVALEIQDDGPGIPADVLPRIFDPFFTTKAQGRGTGLGLAICYGIVADHHGELTVRSEPGRGSTFRMSLPVRGKEEA